MIARSLAMLALAAALAVPARGDAAVVDVTPSTFHEDSLFIRAFIDTLCYVAPTHPVNNDPANWRTRFTFRPEAQSEAVPFLVRRLQAIGATVTTEPFPCTWTSNGTTLTTTGLNIVGRFATRDASFGQEPLIDGRRPLVVLGGHWDSSGLREGTPWISGWQTFGAAGADDNASGLSAALLAARNLAALRFPFDLVVAYFDAEELPGLQGSRAFVRERRATGDSVLLYIDLDTIGYNPDYLRTEAVHNGQSLWLARDLAALNDAAWPRLEEVAILALPGLANSDHFSFWEAGIQALTLVEHYLPEQPFTRWRGSGVYDTRRDTADSLRFDLVTTIAYDVERALRRYSAASGASLPPFALSPGDIAVSWDRASAGAPPNAGQPLDLDLTVHMSSTAGPATWMWEILDEGAGKGSTRIAGGTSHEAYRTLGTTRLHATWSTTAADVGSHRLVLRVTDAVTGAVEYATASTVITLYGPGLRITGIGTVPSPARAGQPIDLHYYLPDTAPVTLTVSDARGRVVERQQIPASIGGSAGARAGDNLARLDADLASGIYFVRLAALRRDGSDASATGRFVVLR